MFLVFFAVFAVSFCTLIKYFREKIVLNDLFWLISFWIFAFGIYSTSGIYYRVRISTETIAYMIIVFICYTVGRFIGCKRSITIYLGRYSEGENISEFTRGWFWIGIISFCVYVLDLFHNNKVIWGVKTKLQFSVFGKASIYIIPVLASVWLYELGNSLKKKEKISVRGWISLLLYCLQMVLSSGRMNIVMIMIASMAEMIYIHFLPFNTNANTQTNFKEKKTHQKFIFIGLILVLIILAYFIFLSNTRYGNEMIEMFEYASGCKISEQTIRILKHTGEFSSLLLNGMYYFSHQLSKLEIIFKSYKGPYLYGAYQFNFFEKFFELFGMNVNHFYSSINKMLSAYKLQGLNSGWDTAIGSSIYDFGRLGTLIFVGVVGFFVGASVNKFNRARENVVRIGMQALLCSGMFMTLELGMFYNRSWPFAMLWACVIPNFKIDLKGKA